MSHISLVIIAFTLGGMARLSWPAGCPVTDDHITDSSTNRAMALVLRWCDQRRYLPPTKQTATCYCSDDDSLY